MEPEEEREGRHKAFRLVLIITGAALLLILLDCGMFAVGERADDSLNPYRSMRIEHADGSVEENVTSDSHLRAGDRAILRIKIPAEWRMQQGSLLFSVTQSYTATYYDGRLLDRYSREDVPFGEHFGAATRRVEVPPDAWGGTMTVVCDVLRSNAHILSNDFVLCPTADAWKFYVQGEGLLFFLYCAILVVCVGALIPLLLSRSTIEARRGIALVSFCSAFVLWSLGYNLMLGIFSSNSFLNASIEYLALFILPIPFLSYMILGERSRKRRLVYRWTRLWCYALLFTAVSFQMTGLASMATFLLPLHLTLFVISVSVAWNKFHPLGREQFWDGVTRYGLVAVLGASALVLIEYHLFSWLGLDVLGISRKVAEWGIVVFVLSLTVSYVTRLLADHFMAREAHALTRMAYIDALTGLTNHAGCLRDANSLEPSKQPFAVLFFDLNGLKETNDLYGHAMGDRLLRAMARVLREAFPKESVSRMGGDEYVVIVQEKETLKEIPARLAQINARLAEISHEPGMPAQLSTSCGVSYNDPAEPKAFEEHMSLADDRMYEDKQRYKLKKFGGRRSGDRLFFRSSPQAEEKKDEP